MADAATIGDLVVRIGGNVEGLVDAAKRGTKALTDMDASGGKVAAGISTSTALIGTAVVGMIVAIDKAVSAAISRFIELGKTSQQIGVPVEQLSRLEFAAKKVGVSTEELSQGIKLFSRNAGEIRSAIEPADAFTLAMQNMQVSLTGSGGKVRDTSSLLLDLSDKFSRMPDGVQKTRLAMELFGRSGAEMIPFLNQGREKLQEYMEQSDKFGATVGKENTEAALKFNNAIKGLSTIFDNVVKALLKEFLPTMESLALMLNGTVKNTETMTLAMDGLRVVFGAVVTAGTLVVGTIKQIFELAGGAARIMKAALAGDWAEAWEAAKNTTVTVLTTMDDTFKAAIGQWIPESVAASNAIKGIGTASAWTATVTKEAFKPVEQTMKQATEAHERARKEFLNGLVIGPSNTEAVIAGLQAALAKGKISLAEFDAAATEALGHKRTLELTNLDAVMSKTTATMQEKMATLEAAVRKGAIGFVQYGKDVKNVERENQQHILDTASLAASTLTTVFKDNKAASIAAAIINTAVGITRTFRDLPAWAAWPQAALIAASGAAQVAQISSTSQDGGGGSPSVGGGGSTAAAAPPAPVEQRQMTVQGFSSREYFRGDVVRDIAQGLIDYQRDGGMVILK